MNNKKINITVDISKTPKVQACDYPITYICGKAHFDQLFRNDLQSSYGIYIFILKESEIKEHGTDFVPDPELLKDPCHISTHIIPDDVTFNDYVVRIANDIKLMDSAGTRTWDFKTLEDAVPR